MPFWGLTLLWFPSLPYWYWNILLSLLLLFSHIFFTCSQVLSVFIICTFSPIYKLAVIKASLNCILIKKRHNNVIFSIQYSDWFCNEPVNKILTCFSAVYRLDYSCIWGAIFCLSVLLRIYSKLGSYWKAVCSSHNLSSSILIQAFHLATS